MRPGNLPTPVLLVEPAGDRTNVGKCTQQPDAGGGLDSRRVTPLVSVVIPAYNSSDYLQKALQSISVAAGEFVCEIIVVDDCSEDVEQLRALLATRDNATLIEKAAKSNAADSRNMGFRAAVGDFVFFLDSDDFFADDHIRHRIDLHMKMSCGVIFGNFSIVENDFVIQSDIVAYSGQNMRDYIFGDNGDVRSSTLSLFRQNHKGTLFDSQQGKHQDWGFAIRCFDAGETMYFDAAHGVFICYCSNIARMSSRMNIEASRYFVCQYLSSRAQLATFVRRHVVLVIHSGDLGGRDFLRELLLDSHTRFGRGARFRIFFLCLLLMPKPSPAYARLVDAGMFGLRTWRFFCKPLLRAFSRDSAVLCRSAWQGADRVSGGGPK
ncbi:glycosyltransferase family 2 protein [Ferribacterium limneticum]|uniref:glycosyltransferase family 2 protein n=1 Tax=Ferribacterium limneticum TaxID=76259 RepID=UPI001CFC3018|nr:glycosyltransferase family 2 protein [Ferribacterium limneticum]UCV18279.1 glycosyltransferase family 2 protein [Ferribacterium limneticum]